MRACILCVNSGQFHSRTSVVGLVSVLLILPWHSTLSCECLRLLGQHVSCRVCFLRFSFFNVAKNTSFFSFTIMLCARIPDSKQNLLSIFVNNYGFKLSFTWFVLIASYRRLINWFDWLNDWFICSDICLLSYQFCPVVFRSVQCFFNLYNFYLGFRAFSFVMKSHWIC